MKNLLKIEELFLFGLALFLFSGLNYGWGASRHALLFFAPDLSMFDYLVDRENDPAAAFQDTHLGVIGNNKTNYEYENR
jgi:hypothetical protein